MEGLEPVWSKWASPLYTLVTSVILHRPFRTRNTVRKHTHKPLPDDISGFWTQMRAGQHTKSQELPCSQGECALACLHFCCRCMPGVLRAHCLAATYRLLTICHRCFRLLLHGGMQAVFLRFRLPVAAIFSYMCWVLIAILIPVGWPLSLLLDFVLREKGSHAGSGVFYSRAGLCELIDIHGRYNKGLRAHRS